MITLLTIFFLNVDTGWSDVRHNVDATLKQAHKFNRNYNLYIKMEAERLKKEREEDSLFRSIKPDRYFVKDKIFRNGAYKDTILYLTPSEIDLFIEKKKGKKKIIQ